MLPLSTRARKFRAVRASVSGGSGAGEATAVIGFSSDMKDDARPQPMILHFACTKNANQGGPIAHKLSSKQTYPHDWSNGVPILTLKVVERLLRDTERKTHWIGYWDFA
jgi:hypothetical protein